MKAFEVFDKLKQFSKQLGDENFTVSFAICEEKCYISVSCHSSSKYEFDHGGLQRTAEIKESDLDGNIDDILNSLIDKYKECLIPRKEKESLNDAIKRIKKVSSSSS